jgi:4a-hydroxytetrahydrobiopterin dehydratase
VDRRKVTEEEMSQLAAQVPEWQIVEPEGIKQLDRVFGFKDLLQALAYTNRVGQLAEAQGHHPALLTEWGKVTVTWWSHDIRGLQRNDFVMAVKTDELYPQD